MEEKTSDWYFTFGYGQAHANKYVVFRQMTFNQAREAMHTAFGDKWSFQYSDSEWFADDVSLSEKWHWTELVLTEHDAAGIDKTEDVEKDRDIWQSSFHDYLLGMRVMCPSCEGVGEHVVDVGGTDGAHHQNIHACVLCNAEGYVRM